MMITLNAGDAVIDYATPKDIPTVKSKGVKGVARYLDPGWKGMRAAELQALYRAGFVVWGIYETYEQRALTGAAGGEFDGKVARMLADQIGFHGPLIVTADFDVTKDNAPVVIEYARAFKKACGAEYVGGYFDGEAAEAMATDDEFVPVWRPSARWWSRFWPNYTHRRTHIIQWTSTSSPVPGTDHGTVVKAFQAWAPDPVAAPPKAPPVVMPLPAPWLRKTALWWVKRSEPVAQLQRALIRLGYLAAGLDDGKFGPVTEAALKRWQTKLGVWVDGVWGPQTATAAINSMH